jgi:hypothetical protein
MVVGNRNSTDFWNDAWCGSSPSYDKFPQLNDICLQQHLIVAEAQSQWRCMRDDLLW